MGGPRRHRERGFTMVEVLIAMSIFMLILAGVFQVFGPSNVLYASGQRKVDTQQSARVAMDIIVRELRMAGYFPENFDTPVANDIVAPQNPIQIATGTALAIHGAADGCVAANAPPACDDPVPPTSQVFFFCLNGTNLLRKVGPLAAAPSYTCSIDTPDGQEVLADNITALTFAYLDGNNGPVPGPLSGPPPVPLDGEGPGLPPVFGSTIQRDAVRTVVITLTAQENVPGQPAAVYTLTSNVRLRNL